MCMHTKYCKYFRGFLNSRLLNFSRNTRKLMYCEYFHLRVPRHTFWVHSQSDTQWYPGLHKIIQLCSILDWESRPFFPPCILTCHWWRYKLWIHHIAHRDATFQEISWNQEICDRKNFRKNETVSLDKNNDRKGGKGLEKRKIYPNSLIKHQNGNYSILLSVQSGILVQLLSAS